MTFMEWYKQTAREVGNGIPFEMVKDIMVRAIRVALEEFIANPTDATLDIKGIGRFYLNRRIVNITEDIKCDEDQLIRWSIHFKPSKCVKDAINGKSDPREMVIGTVIPLYPEYIYRDGTKSKGAGKKFKTKPKVTEYKVERRKSYVQAVEKMERKEAQEAQKKLKEKLPEVE